jgi:hypothetical protein
VAKERDRPVDYIQTDGAEWNFYEDSGQVIPLNDAAVDLMRP